MANIDPEWQKYHSTLPDGGPLYTETDLSHLIVEPWNAISSMAFLFPAIYWAFKLRRSPRTHWFLLYCSFLVFIGGTGSTLFHAFRSHRWLIVMDFLPMAIATLSLCIFFWYQLLRRLYLVIALIPPVFAIRYWAFSGLSHHSSINASYFFAGTLFFLPMLLLLKKYKWKHTSVALLGLGSFVIALLFRQMDVWNPPLLPMGTHFLWHLAGAMGCHFIARFVYLQHFAPPAPSNEVILT